MLVDILKFIHLLLTLSLVGCTLFCLVRVSSKNPLEIEVITRINSYILALLALALITGTCLVHPKNFSFHTPWIQAAYILVILFGLLLSGLIILLKKRRLHKGWRWYYFTLALLLLVVIHDAVSKTTFLL